MIREWMLEMDILVMVQLLVMTWCKIKHGHGWLIFRQRENKIFGNEQVRELGGQVGGWCMSSSEGKSS